MSVGISSPRQRLLFVNGDGRVSPWAEAGTAAPEGFAIEGWPLAHAHEWQPVLDTDTISFILIDVDVIARTQPLDDWAFKAWRSTLNDFVLKCTAPSGQAPLLLAYSREPTWDSALVALRVGARDMTKLSRLNERLRELTGQKTRAEEVSSENLVSLSDRRSPTPPSELSTEEVAIHAAQPSIPKHAIPFPIEGLEGTSTAIETVRNLIRKTAPLESNVLVSGPTGSGKERVARAIHRYSARAQGPFVAVNCGALAPGLIESELFGHTKGSFTGASDDRIGYLEAASGGTLFLDEVTELPLEFQVKLLRVLQDRQITPVGASKSVSLDLRLVAATKHDIEERVALGKFREDLMYRVRVMDIALPALRERRADLLIIAKTILKKLAKTSRRSVLSLAEPVVEKFLLHTWPGNIRELENALDHAATLCWGDARMIIELRDLPDTIQFATMGTGKDQQLKDIVRNFEREYIASTVRRLGSKEQAAEVLGLSLATLYRKLGS